MPRATLCALVTGIAGFAGSHLAEHLLEQLGVEVHGVHLAHEGLHNLEHILTRLVLHAADLSDARRVQDILAEVRPDYVFHLAAQASVDRAWSNPAETLVNNIIAELNVLQGILVLGISPRVLVVGSADEYGLVFEKGGIDEETPLRPLNPYAVSKIAQDYLAYQYHLSHGLHIIRVRPFNHIGPRQGPGFVTSDFARQIARIEAGLQEPILRVGNLTAVRDFTDVRDMARAYHLALTRGKPGMVYNIGSSQGYTIQEILDRLIQMSKSPIEVSLAPERLRPSDVPILLCDSRRFRADTGWEPLYDLSSSLRDVLQYWRQHVIHESGQH
jgi:GDP-4-dehydro-6-deoxy-D-mannose reductase